MRALILALFLCLCATPALAAFEGPGTTPGAAQTAPQGGFKGPQSAAITQASQVATAYEDTQCTLTGSLTEQLSKNRYTFRDASGTTIVNIGKKKFRGQTVTPDTRIRIVGEVDFDHGGREVDVDHLEIVS